MSTKHFELEVRPRIPEGLSGLTELAGDLMYSWDRDIRALFRRLDNTLYEACAHNPKVFLSRVSQETLEAAETDPSFRHNYNRVLSGYRSYHDQGLARQLVDWIDPAEDLIAYFCLEFGLHESVQIYSGGLGILAGDHCKAASDLGIPFVAVGLLYRQGYFEQTIDRHGNQIAHLRTTRFEDLPIERAQTSAGEPAVVTVELPAGEARLNVWRAKIGRITLLLLDSDREDNVPEHRAITHQLYGGDGANRIRQEIVLGVGGTRALALLGFAPNVWHINEGHAALLILERCRALVAEGWELPGALEQVAAATVFTTHTPVAAGHDVFPRDQIRPYFETLFSPTGIDTEALLELGRPESTDEFNMTALAMRGSRFQNGVSALHGRVAASMESYVWPEISADENPVRHVTNGVHLPTFLAQEWSNLFDMRFENWRDELCNPDFWSCIQEIPDHRFWSLRRELKTEMLETIHAHAIAQHTRNGIGDAATRRITAEIADPERDVLVLGFARRFATYKRAGLLFQDRQRLARLLNDPERPTVIVMAGKAHPHDQPGQDLIREIHALSLEPEFIGKVLLLEGYDMSLGRVLVTGVDVWLNTPEHPKEASGTSGEKAGINGVLNLSVLDGWWAEGYTHDNGWAIAPQSPDLDPSARDHGEAEDLLDILENQVVPSYFARDPHGYSRPWIRMAKRSMQTVIPRFNAERMVTDYLLGFYGPARAHNARLAADDGAGARTLAAWKRRIIDAWDAVRINAVRVPTGKVLQQQSLHAEIDVELGAIDPADVAAELVFIDANEVIVEQHSFAVAECGASTATLTLDFEPAVTGLQRFRIRLYPSHSLLRHPFEMGRMRWCDSAG